MFKTFPVLETGRLVLRQISLQDTETIYNHCKIPEMSLHTTWDIPKSSDDTKAFIEHVLKSYEEKRGINWAIVLKGTGELVGTIDLMGQVANGIGELAYGIYPPYWGRGIGTEAARAVVDFGFEVMGLVRIQARVFPDNIGSERIMEKLGMVYEGTYRKAMFVKGGYRDLKVYALIREDLGDS